MEWLHDWIVVSKRIVELLLLSLSSSSPSSSSWAYYSVRLAGTYCIHQSVVPIAPRSPTAYHRRRTQIFLNLRCPSTISSTAAYAASSSSCCCCCRWQPHCSPTRHSAAMLIRELQRRAMLCWAHPGRLWRRWIMFDLYSYFKNVISETNSEVAIELVTRLFSF